MKHSIIPALLFAAAAACGGGAKKNTTPDQDPVTTTEPPPTEPPPTEPAPPPEPAKPVEPAPPPPPKTFTAKVELAPVKGAKHKAVAITFTETEGSADTAVAGDTAIEGLKPGKYHLVFHSGAECGSNATKAGKAIADAAPIAIEVTKEAPTATVSGNVAMKVEGDKTLVGKTLVLHADKKGKPGKALACGSISKSDAAAPAAGGAAPSTP